MPTLSKRLYWQKMRDALRKKKYTLHFEVQ